MLKFTSNVIITALHWNFLLLIYIIPNGQLEIQFIAFGKVKLTIYGVVGRWSIWPFTCVESILGRIFIFMFELKYLYLADNITSIFYTPNDLYS